MLRAGLGARSVRAANRPCRERDHPTAREVRPPAVDVGRTQPSRNVGPQAGRSRRCSRSVSTDCHRRTGTRIGELLPQLARRADQYAILRSLSHDQKDHNVAGTIGLTGHVFGAKASGGVPFPGNVRPSLGSLVSYLRRHETGDWPGFTCLGPNCKVSGENLRGQTAGILGTPHDPFRLEGYTYDDGVRIPPSLEPTREVPAERLGRRRDLLGAFDAWQAKVEAGGEVERYSDIRRKAFALVSAGATKGALNLEAEPDRVRDRYGRTVFGQNVLLGRRLVEAGVPFVQVNWSGDAEDEQQGGDGGWDLHYRLFERMQERYCPMFDHTFAALLDDLRERGLLDTTLVIAMGEFGRSPKISDIGGREHWPFVYSAVVAGGGCPERIGPGCLRRRGGLPTTAARASGESRRHGAREDGAGSVVSGGSRRGHRRTADRRVAVTTWR